jgi:hypothetical protein
LFCREALRKQQLLRYGGGSASKYARRTHLPVGKKKQPQQGAATAAGVGDGGAVEVRAALALAVAVTNPRS